MKKAMILIFVLNSLISFSQIPKIKLTSKGIAIVNVTFSDLTLENIFKRTAEWLAINHDNIDEIMEVNNQSKAIIIRTVEPNVWTPFRGGKIDKYSIEYTLIIEFNQQGFSLCYQLGKFEKDGKKLTTSTEDLFDKHKGNILDNYKDAVKSIENKLNTNNESLCQFISTYDNRNFATSKK